MSVEGFADLAKSVGPAVALGLGMMWMFVKYLIGRDKNDNARHEAMQKANDERYATVVETITEKLRSLAVPCHAAQERSAEALKDSSEAQREGAQAIGALLEHVRRVGG